MSTVEKIMYSITGLVMLVFIVAMLDVACMLALDMRLTEVPRKAAIAAGLLSSSSEPAAPASMKATPTSKPVLATPTPQPPTATPKQPTPTPKPKPVEPTGRTMYVCGYDTCRDSGEYGQLVFETGINVWNNPDPDRGGVHHQVSHGDEVAVIGEKRANDGPGGLWYALESGGWIDDLWLTDTPCTLDNLDEYSFTDCLMGKY